MRQKHGAVVALDLDADVPSTSIEALARKLAAVEQERDIWREFALARERDREAPREQDRR